MAQLSWRQYLLPGTLPHIWCPGCGNGIILQALLRAFAQLQLDPRKIVVVTGIGCWGKADDYIKANTFHGTHGRALAFATGIKVARPELNVVVLMGDGDCGTIGGNHLLHAARRNIDLTAVVANNYNYGMTGGQHSCTTPEGMRTSTTGHGNPEPGLDICRIAQAAGANYVARSTAYHAINLKKLITEAILNKGFSLVEAISPCPTYYGRHNGMPSPVQMMRWLSRAAVASQPAEQPDQGGILIGRFINKTEPDYNTRYESLRQKALQAGKTTGIINTR